MGRLFSRAKMGSSAFSQVLAPLADCKSLATLVSHGPPSACMPTSDALPPCVLTLRLSTKCSTRVVKCHCYHATLSCVAKVTSARPAGVLHNVMQKSTDLDYNIWHTVTHHRGRGRIPLVHLLGQLNMCCSSLVFVCILRQALQYCISHSPFSCQHPRRTLERPFSLLRVMHDYARIH